MTPLTIELNLVDVVIVDSEALRRFRDYDTLLPQVQAVNCLAGGCPDVVGVRPKFDGGNGVMQDKAFHCLCRIKRPQPDLPVLSTRQQHSTIVTGLYASHSSAFAMTCQTPLVHPNIQIS